MHVLHFHFVNVYVHWSSSEILWPFVKTAYEPISCHWSLFIPPENITKSLVFWCFQGLSKEISGRKYFNNKIWKILSWNKKWNQKLYKKWSFPLRISSVNVTKTARKCGFGHIYWRNPLQKTSFFVQWNYFRTIFIWHNDYDHDDDEIMMINICVNHLSQTSEKLVLKI